MMKLTEESKTGPAVELMAKAWLFHSLSRCFADPSAPGRHFATSRDAVERTEQVVLRLDESELSRLWKSLRDALGELAITDREPTLGQEYAYLFMGRVKVPLNEASYGIDLTFARSREMADIASYYAAFGFQLGPDAMDTSDHLAIQLEFMAVLCLKEAYALEQGWQEEAQVCREARSLYLTEHLTGWLPILAERMRSKARLPFYPAAVDLARHFIALEHAFVGADAPTIVLRQPETPRDDDLPLSCGGCPAFSSEPTDLAEVNGTRPGPQ